MSPAILIPLDESTTAEHTRDAVIRQKDLLPREILLLHVVDVNLVQRLIPDMQKAMVYEAAEKSGRRILDKLAGPFRAAGFDPILQLELGTPEEVILKVVEAQNIELVIFGRHPGSGGIRDIMFGSVANHVVRKVKCPVLLV